MTKVTKVNKLSRNLAIASLLAPVGVNALGIGEIQLHSALNQNFLAKIPLIASPGENTKDIRVTLASPAAFQKAGVERSYLLSTLKFKPELNADGTMSVKVLSNDAIREPFLNFLIEVKWAEGRMLKEYTVLLDPPSYIEQPVVTAQTAPKWQSQNTSTSSNKAETANRVTEEERIYGEQAYPDYQAETTIASPGSSTYSEPLTSSTETATFADNSNSVVVSKGAVLWDIAEQMRQNVGASQAQMLIALFKANPDAFYNNNINALKAGATLNFPEPEMFDSIAEKESIQAVKQHNTRWNTMLMTNKERRQAAKTSVADTQKDQLTLTATEGDEANTKDQALLERLQSLLSQVDLMTEENTSLKTQVAELEARIQQISQQATVDQTTTQKQIEDIDATVTHTAAIDAGDSQDKVDTDKQSVISTEAQPIATEKSGTQIDSAAPVVKTVDKPIVKKPITSTQITVDKPVVKKPITPAQNNAQSDFLSDMMESPWAIGSVLGALLLGLIGWQMSRRRKLVLQEEMELDELNAGSDNKQEDVAADSQSDDSEHASEQDSELGNSVFFSEYRPTEANIDTQAMEVDHNDLDPISEADVYVAYGRYQQAEELIQQALTDHPDRDEYKLKLLEIYHAKDDSAGFAAYVTELKDEGNTTSPDFWTRAQEIGTGFAPDNLFGEAPSIDEVKEVEEFSSELFGIDSEAASLELNDNLSAILTENASGSRELDDVQSIDLGEAGETVEQLETAFELDELNTESMQISLDESDGFTVNLTNLDVADNGLIDSQNDIASVLAEDEELNSESSTEMGIDFDAALTQSLDIDAGVSNTSSIGTSESFEFDSEEVETSTWGLDIESFENVQIESEMPLDSANASSVLAETEAMEPISSIDMDVETSDSLGLLSTDAMALDSVSIGLDSNEATAVDESTVDLQLDEAAVENTSEDFQLVTEASVLQDDAEQDSYVIDKESTMFHLDDISSELVESAQISEILDEVTQRNTEFAEESVISELFEPASIFQESELFESELSDLDEVADKLDLAKAYIDMEDGESARGILKEVIESGTDDQIEVAKSMVQALEKSA